jgi:hypothetical protein
LTNYENKNKISVWRESGPHAMNCFYLISTFKKKGRASKKFWSLEVNKGVTYAAPPPFPLEKMKTWKIRQIGSTGIRFRRGALPPNRAKKIHAGLYVGYHFIKIRTLKSQNSSAKVI